MTETVIMTNFEYKVRWVIALMLLLLFVLIMVGGPITLVVVITYRDFLVECKACFGIFFDSGFQRLDVTKMLNNQKLHIKTI